MNVRRKVFEREACRLMGMGGIRVYERKIGWLPEEHYYDIVWRGRRRWSVGHPWDANKGALASVGLNMRFRASMDETFERMMGREEFERAEKERDDRDAREVMTREVLRTVSDKPLYFYS